jgi:NADH-ubiquinone oxidoreductase chain 2
MQYSITNLNAFMLLISIGYTFIALSLIEKAPSNISNISTKRGADNNPVDTDYEENDENLQEKNVSPIQLISQLKGYFYVNPLLSISLAITLFSFIGVPPLVGFFAKQMILSAALDNGYVFMTLLAILTSVISAVYYLVVIQKIFFEKSVYTINKDINTNKEE